MEIRTIFETFALKQADEITTQFSTIVARSRLGLESPTILVWAIEDAPKSILSLFLKLSSFKKEDNITWLAIIPSETKEIPIMLDGLWGVLLSDGKRLIAG